MTEILIGGDFWPLLLMMELNRANYWMNTFLQRNKRRSQVSIEIGKAVVSPGSASLPTL